MELSHTFEYSAREAGEQRDVFQLHNMTILVLWNHGRSALLMEIQAGKSGKPPTYNLVIRERMHALDLAGFITTDLSRQKVHMAQGVPKSFSRRLIKILTTIDRFRVEAEQEGDVALSNALQGCALNMSGGNLDCPIGNPIVEESARTGKFPADYLMQTPSDRSGPSPQKSMPDSEATGNNPPLDVMKWRSTFMRLWTVLKEDAKLEKDQDCLEALEDCENLTTEHRCPVRELIVQALWHADKSKVAIPYRTMELRSPVNEQAFRDSH